MIEQLKRAVQGYIQASAHAAAKAVRVELGELLSEATDPLYHRLTKIEEQLAAMQPKVTSVANVNMTGIERVAAAALASMKRGTIIEDGLKDEERSRGVMGGEDATSPETPAAKLTASFDDGSKLIAEFDTEDGGKLKLFTGQPPDAVDASLAFKPAFDSAAFDVEPEVRDIGKWWAWSESRAPIADLYRVAANAVRSPGGSTARLFDLQRARDRVLSFFESIELEPAKIDVRAVKSAAEDLRTLGATEEQILAVHAHCLRLHRANVVQKLRSINEAYGKVGEPARTAGQVPDPAGQRDAEQPTADVGQPPPNQEEPAPIVGPDRVPLSNVPNVVDGDCYVVPLGELGVLRVKVETMKVLLKRGIGIHELTQLAEQLKLWSKKTDPFELPTAVSPTALVSMLCAGRPNEEGPMYGDLVAAMLTQQGIVLPEAK